MSASSSHLAGPSTHVNMMNGNTHDVDGHVQGAQEPSLEELERDLPVVYDGQVPLGELLSRMAQTVYAELQVMAETLPGMSDTARKRTIADWVVKTKKQIVKLYVVVKWSRDAAVVQKAMNITAFLLEQNRQFESGIENIEFAKNGLAPAKLRNHDLLTALDVLTTGTYTRLPSVVKKTFIPKPRMTDAEVVKTLRDMEDVIRFRLRVREIIPIEMSRYHIRGGRVFFTVPNAFEASLSLTGAGKEDGWFFVHVEFLHNVGGDMTGGHEFPRMPKGVLKQRITEEADGRLSYYVPIPVDPNVPPEFAPPPKPKLPIGVVDAPLVRLYNYLNLMALSYQLEILFYQAQRLRSLGWKDHLSLEKSSDGKRFAAKYWVRPALPARPGQASRSQLPLFGGSVSVTIVQTHASARAGGGPLRSPMGRILAQLQKDSKAADSRLSDEVESFMLEVKWEPVNGALAVDVPEVLLQLPAQELAINPNDLNFEAILRKAIFQHTHGILQKCRYLLQNGNFHRVFSPPGEVEIFLDEGNPSMKMHLCGNEYLAISIDARTGKFTLRDTGDLASAGRKPVLAILTERINLYPHELLGGLVNLRYTTIIESAEQKAQYLGLQTYRHRNFSDQDIASLGMDVRVRLFIKLSNSSNYYLVVLATDSGFRFAIIEVRPNILSSDPGQLSIVTVGRLDVKRIHGDEVSIRDTDMNVTLSDSEFNIDAGLLRELYAYCCARVAYSQVELQLQQRNIPCMYTNPIPSAIYSADISHIHSSLSRSVPGLCVQASDILAGAPAAEAAMPNIRVIPLNWWSSKTPQVVMCVKLKYVQHPMGKRAGTSTVIRPSKRIIYDTKEAVVSFLSENVSTCVDEFLEEWAKVSKMVVIAREISQIAKKYRWTDIRLLSFDLQTVEFAYAKDYTVLITCTDQLLATSNSTPSYELRFSRVPRTLTRKSTAVSNVEAHRPHTPRDQFVFSQTEPNTPSRTYTSSSSQATLIGDASESDEDELYNPHEDVEPFLRHLLRHGPLLTSSLHELVRILRDSLPVVCAVEDIRQISSIKRSASQHREKPVVKVDTLVKAAGWYRVVYGDMRHALDFRLMKGRRVAILDASYFNLGLSYKGKDMANSSLPATTTDSSSASLFRPIPQFSDLVRDIVRDVSRSVLQQRAASMHPPPPTNAPTPVHTAPSPIHTYTAPPTPGTQTRDPRLQAAAHGIPGLTASAASPRSHPPTPTLTASTVPQRSNAQGLAQSVLSPKLSFMAPQSSPQMSPRPVHQRSASSSSIQASPRLVYAQAAQLQAQAQAQAQAVQTGSPPFNHASPRPANANTPTKGGLGSTMHTSTASHALSSIPSMIPLPLIAHIDVGLVCDVDLVQLPALPLHSLILEKLQGTL